MSGISVSHLSFTYPQETVPALRDVSFSVEEGEFLTLIGPSGGGKSTLLRALKPALTPHGSFTGEISFFGEPLSALDARRQAAEICFVLQKPDEQIVTDRVWHELAFGMESLGFATPVIRRRVAEMASFFGIEEWFSRPVEALSGGQKQLLNLASVMALQPRVLLLDEPTSQLDPIAAADFLNAVARIRRELGTTVILSEHRLEEALPLCDRVLALEQTVLAHGTPQEVSRTLRAADSPVYFSMPTPVRGSGSVGADECPVTVTEGRQWLARYAASHPLADVPPRRLRPAGEELLGLKDVWFRYEKDGEDVLQDLSCSFARGQLTALLGGNGSGKTTTAAKLTRAFQEEGKSVVLAAADTFRAGAVDQLARWGERLGAPCIKGKEIGDPSAVLVDACRYARAHECDYLIGDPAGRLQNKVSLMNELTEMRRVIGREIPDAPHEVWLVLDATTGQNGIQQAKVVLEATAVSGIILTKMDGTAKGGIVLAIRDQLGLPVRYIGLGEHPEDLRPFDIESYQYGICEGMSPHA